MTNHERRLLELLAGSEDGANHALLQAHGFTLQSLINVVGAGLASATPERVYAAGKPVDVARMRITAAGRRALAEPAGLG